MSSSFSLKRLKQCDKCPWKKDSNPYEIPYGYSLSKHQQLSITIAREEDFSNMKTLYVMACHHSSENNQMHCIGWLNNQLGIGNNILLRLHMMNCTNIDKIEIVGEQHEKFEDTIPKR